MLLVDRESHRLVTNVGNLNTVLGIMNLEREVTVNIGNAMSNNTTDDDSFPLKDGGSFAPPLQGANVS